MESEGALEIIRGAIAALNAERASEDPITLDEDTALLDENSQLDSLEFVSLLTDVETRLKRATGRSLMLISEGMASDERPFRTIRTLADFIVGVAQR